MFGQYIKRGIQLLLPLFFVTLSINALGQYAVTPKKSDIAYLRSLEELPSINIPSLSLSELKQLKEETQSSPFRDTYTIGVNRTVNLCPQKDGKTYINNRNQLIWELRISSNNAKAMQVHFSKFNLEEGAQLLLGNKFGQYKGAFTHYNNSLSQQLSIAPLRGNEIIIHYQSAPNKPYLPELTIGKVSLYAETLGASDWRLHQDGEPWGEAPVPCAKNIIEFKDVNELSRSLVLIVVRGRTVCSGALINNTLNDGKAYVLTAAHCMNRSFKQPNNKEYRDTSAQQSVFFFNFRSPIGKTFIRGTEEQSLAGAKIVAWDESRDLCLLEITGIQPPEIDSRCGIPYSYRPFFAGWNRGTPYPPFFGLHHPLGSMARYNLSKQNISRTTFLGTPLIQEKMHWEIKRWDIGTTAGGSSGSPLFDSHYLIIGALTGGNSTCEKPISDQYYSLDKCWDKKLPKKMTLNACLDPQNTGVEKCYAYDPYAPIPAERLSNNLYSRYRDVFEVSTPYLKGITAIASQYFIKDEVKILGVKIVGVPLLSDFKKTRLVILTGDENAPLQEIASQELLPPTFLKYNNEEDVRTFGRIMEFFIPLEFPIPIENNSYLYIGLKSTELGKELSFSVIRMRPIPNAKHSAFGILSNQAQTWINLEKVKDKKIQYHGNFWIDPIIQPSKANSSPQLRFKTTKAKVFVSKNNLTIQLNKNKGSSAIIRVFDMNGLLLHQQQTQKDELLINTQQFSQSNTLIVQINIEKEENCFKVFLHK